MNDMFSDCYNLKKLEIKKEFEKDFKNIIKKNNIRLECYWFGYF